MRMRMTSVAAATMLLRHARGVGRAPRGHARLVPGWATRPSWPRRESRRIVATEPKSRRFLDLAPQQLAAALLGHLHVAVGLEAARAAALRDGPQVRRVAERLGQRHGAAEIGR